MDLLATPVTVGGLTLKNPIVFAPTSLGMPPKQALAKLTRIAQGGAGLIILGDVSTIEGGFGYSVCRQSDLDFFHRLLKAVRPMGAKVSAQLFISGNPPGLSKPVGLSPEEARARRNQAIRDFVTEMPQSQMENWIDSFGKGAAVCQEIGFDMIQIHGDQLCGAFLSPLFNRREDEYGGDVQGRTLFLRRCIQAAQKAAPGLTIDLKLPVRQENPRYGNGGLRKDELPQAIPLIEQAGPDCYHITLANHGALSDTVPPTNHPYFQQEGCFLPFADMVRPYTQKPICGVGKLQTPDFIRQQLQSGRIQLAAMSRQLIADPDWPLKALGRETEIRRCVYCNADCLGGMTRRQGVHCIYDDEQNNRDCMETL